MEDKDGAQVEQGRGVVRDTASDQIRVDCHCVAAMTTMRAIL